MRSIALLCVTLLVASTGGCGVWTSYQSVAVDPAQRSMRWGKPDNGVRMGIKVDQDTSREDDGLVQEDCRFWVHFEVVQPRVPAVAQALDQPASTGCEGATWLVIGGAGMPRAMTVTLTLPTGERYTLPHDDAGDLVGIERDYSETFDLTDIAPRFKSPSTATLTVTYHLDPDPSNPDQWSGTLTTPPIQVKFYRMRSWSLFG